MVPVDSRQVETMYFDVVEHVLYIYSIFPPRFATPETSLCLDLLRVDDLQ